MEVLEAIWAKMWRRISPVSSTAFFIVVDYILSIAQICSIPFESKQTLTNSTKPTPPPPPIPPIVTTKKPQQPSHPAIA
jgi:hypothetical protein